MTLVLHMLVYGDIINTIGWRETKIGARIIVEGRWKGYIDRIWSYYHVVSK